MSHIPPKIPRQPDVVVIFWESDPLEPKKPPIITSVCVQGRAKPCDIFLEIGRNLYTALGCLVFNDFKIIFSTKLTDVSGFIVLEDRKEKLMISNKHD